MRLHSTHPVEAFTCGTRPGSKEIDKYLQVNALNEQAAHLAAIWIVENTAATSRADRLVGFFSLSPVSIRLSAPIMEALNIIAPYQMIGGWLLGRMGIAQQYQGHRRGRLLVASAIKIAKELRDATAGVFLAIDPANDSLTQWYLDLDFGFQRLAPNDLKILRLAMKI